MNVDVVGDGSHVRLVIESGDGRLHLETVARTNGVFISIADAVGNELHLHTTVAFADRMATALRREVTAWRKRTSLSTSMRSTDTPPFLTPTEEETP